VEKLRILVADDNEINRLLITSMLEEECEIVEAHDGEETLFLMQKYHGDIDLLLLDLVMPEMDGIEVLKKMNMYGWIKYIPVIVISAESSASYTRKAFELGAEDYISRPFDPVTVSHRIKKAIGLHAEKNNLIDALTKEFNDKERQNDMMITLLSHIVEQRNGESGVHVVHIKVITEFLLKELLRRTDKYKISEDDISVICNASSFHDIGKTVIPENILNKPAKLTAGEFEIMKTHAVLGYEMLKTAKDFEKEPLFVYAQNICHYHHERWDGRGYPDGLKGDEIPIEAQIVSVADVYDALTSERCYKSAFSHEEAKRMIVEGECGTFNPLIIDCFNAISEDLQKTLAQENKPQEINTGEIYNKHTLSRISKSNTDVSRNIRISRAEAQKYETFLEFTSEAWFEYYTKPEAITFNESGAKLFDLPKQIISPSKNKEFLENCGIGLTECLSTCAECQENATSIEKEFVSPDGKKYKLKLKVFRVAFDSQDDTVVGYIIGKIVS